ncbi:hypothetical protein RRSWK_01135 [Rhodopirellula sp. SWK7]|nr:hypothetical protein RRSWK_01135 [Rhodopirellula sp. SWK7]
MASEGPLRFGKYWEKPSAVHFLRVPFQNNQPLCRSKISGLHKVERSES